jgi:hypothetical protein
VLEGDRPVSLQQILTFATGSDAEPPLGYPSTPVLDFIHSLSTSPTDKIFPTANTCGLILRLPVVCEYGDFIELMENGIIQSPTFGQS